MGYKPSVHTCTYVFYNILPSQIFFTYATVMFGGMQQNTSSICLEHVEIYYQWLNPQSWAVSSLHTVTELVLASVVVWLKVIVATSLDCNKSYSKWA